MENSNDIEKDCTTVSKDGSSVDIPKTEDAVLENASLVSIAHDNIVENVKQVGIAPEDNASISEELSTKENDEADQNEIKVFDNSALLNSILDEVEVIKNGSVEDSEETPSVVGDSNLFDGEEALDKGAKQVYILSSAGKPVYRWRGNEDKVVTLFGVMQALVSVVQDLGDSIQAVHAGNTVIVFLVKEPIILVSVNPKGESIEFLQNQLTYVYNQIVSVLTLSQLTKIFETRHNFDLRRLLDGSERLIDHLLCFTETQPEFMLDSISCLDMPQSARFVISRTLVKCCNKKNIVFALLIGNNKIITIVHMKNHEMNPSDTHLLLSLITSSESFKVAESWTPICLPGFNPTGYLLAHISYICAVPACLILLTPEPDSFTSLSTIRTQIETVLTGNQCDIVLRDALLKAPINMDQINLKCLKHFIYKCKTTSQIFYPVIPSSENPEELIKLYEQLHSKINHSCRPLKIYYQVCPKRVLFGWSPKNFELYICFEPDISKASCLALTSKLLEWIVEQENRIFMQQRMTI